MVEEVGQVVLTLEMIAVVHNMVEDSAKVQRQEKEMMEDLEIKLQHLLIVEVDRVVNKIVGVQKDQRVVKVVTLQYKLMVQHCLVDKEVLLKDGEAVEEAVAASSVAVAVQMMVTLGEVKAVVLDLLL